ncbi:hypothetical protein DPMN_087064 [Dreissena polymorpha]|uniref:Uncharacterized protein n=1 Tax=Dreissena polymorpha TaxID=45954 RepID=A0A9D4QW11_DREPO|nr:hypothetical protein DPMN_087064 [Dreissena polymorpha]
MEVNAVNLNLINPSKDSYITEDSETQKITPPVYIDDGIDVKKAQSEEKDHRTRKGEREGNSTRYILIDQILYYLSDKDEEPILRLFIPSSLQARLVEHYHDNLALISVTIR